MECLFLRVVRRFSCTFERCLILTYLKGGQKCIFLALCQCLEPRNTKGILRTHSPKCFFVYRLVSWNDPQCL
jgi:hypothetical protein